MQPGNEDRPIGEQIEEAINNAISEALKEFESSFVTKWVALVESVNADGERGMWTFTAEGMKRWDIMGMVQESIMFQQAHITLEVLENHGH